MPGTMMMKRPMMKKGGKALKKVKPNQKGLKKLPKKVRNKMGYFFKPFWVTFLNLFDLA